MTPRLEAIDTLNLMLTFPAHAESIHFAKEFADAVLEHLNGRLLPLTYAEPLRVSYNGFGTDAIVFENLYSSALALGRDRLLAELSQFCRTLEQTMASGIPDIPASTDFAGFFEQGFEMELIDTTMRTTLYSGILDQDGSWLLVDGPAPAGQRVGVGRNLPIVRRPSAPAIVSPELHLAA